MAFLLNILAGASALLGSVCSSAKQTLCANASFLFSGATWLGSGAATQLAIEIGDQNFTTIATSTNPGDASKFPQSPVASTLLQTIGLLNAIYATANKATGAAKAGSAYWLQQQLVALDSYQKQLNPVLIKLMAAMNSYETPSYGQISQAKDAVISYQEKTNKLIDQLKNDAELAGLRVIASCLWPQQAGEGFRKYAHRVFCDGVGAAIRQRTTE